MKTKNIDSHILSVVESQWIRYNIEYFKGKMEIPQFDLFEGETYNGLWVHNGNTRIIRLNRNLFKKFSNWFKVKIVLKHEMAHQYIDEVLNVDVDTHGELFKQIAQEHEFESLLESECIQEKQEQDSIIDKIEKLFSLAGSENVNESENAMKFANKLMRKWNISNLDRSERNFVYRIITEPTGRRNVVQRGLCNLLIDHFFIQGIWVYKWNRLSEKRGWCLEIMGTPENVELANYVYDYIMNVGEQRFKTIKKKNPNTKKMSFIFGMVSGFNYKLDEQEREFEDKVSNGDDLVWNGDPKLDEYYDKRYPKRRNFSGGYAGRGEGYGDGYDQGKGLTINKGVVNNSGNGGKLLK